MRSKEKVRAIVRILGCENQTVYGTSVEAVRRRAMMLLLAHPPGFANTMPVSVEVQGQQEDGSYTSCELIAYTAGMALCDLCRWAKWDRDAAGRIRTKSCGECTLTSFPPPEVPACMRVTTVRCALCAGNIVHCKFFEHETQASKP